MDLLIKASGAALTLALAFATASSSVHGDHSIALAVPGRANANVSLAAAGQFVVATWAASDGAGTDIYAAVSRDEAATFGPPVRVNSIAGEARVNGEQPPRAAVTARRGGQPTITVVWTAKGANGTTLRTAQSVDGGRRFSQAALVPGTDAAGNRGWEAIAGAADGTVHLVWLDHRRLAEQDAAVATSHHEHGAGAKAQRDGVAMAQLSQLYVATLGSREGPRPITGGVCYCCKTALGVSPDGAVFAAWRHVYPGNLRDIAFTTSADRGRTFAAPVRVSEDKWQIEGCPDDGPAMAVEPTGRVHLIWPTLVQSGKEQTIGLFYSWSSDGRRFSTREPLPTRGLAHHPVAALARSGSLLAAWDELENGVRHLVVGRRSLSNAHASFTREVVAGSDGGVYPSLAAIPQGAVLGWTAGAGTTGSIRIMKITELN